MACNLCGNCCHIFFINLTESEYRSKSYQTIFQNHEFIEDFKKAEEIGANILAKKPNGNCIYLENNKCSIHQKRPQVCRPFFCDSKNPQFKDMIDQINKFRSNQ
jgi:Fe-S-cluster containining protein